MASVVNTDHFGTLVPCLRTQDFRGKSGSVDNVTRSSEIGYKVFGHALLANMSTTVSDLIERKVLEKLVGHISMAKVAAVSKEIHDDVKQLVGWESANIERTVTVRYLGARAPSLGRSTCRCGCCFARASIFVPLNQVSELARGSVCPARVG